MTAVRLHLKYYFRAITLYVRENQGAMAINEDMVRECIHHLADFVSIVAGLLTATELALLV